MSHRLPLLLLILLTASGLAQGPAFRPRSAEERQKRMQQRVETSGVQKGALMPDLDVVTLDGQPFKLATLWREKPLVLVTASITCPIAMEQCPSLQGLREKHAADANTVVLYVREAHPAPAGTPLTAGESGHGAQPQPTSLDDRLTLARAFAKEFAGGATVLVATMDPAALERLGAGPNSGLLIDTQGRLAAKHGWYDPAAMSAALQALRP